MTAAETAGPATTPLAAFYDASGSADAPAIVFIHGTRLNRVAWERIAPHLLTNSSELIYSRDLL